MFFLGVDCAFGRDRPVPASACSADATRRSHPMSRWYIIHAYSGFENKVREFDPRRGRAARPARAVEAVEVPTETVTEVKRGKKVQVERKFMPGYVLAKLSLTDDVYHLVKNTPKVTGFLGPNGKPQPISEREAARYFGAKDETAAAAPKTQDQRRLRDRRLGQGARRPVRQLQRHRRGARFRQAAGSRSASRSSAARPRSSSSSSRSSWPSKLLRDPGVRAGTAPQN